MNKKIGLLVIFAMVFITFTVSVSANGDPIIKTEQNEVSNDYDIFINSEVLKWETEISGLIDKLESIKEREFIEGKLDEYRNSEEKVKYFINKNESIHRITNKVINNSPNDMLNTQMEILYSRKPSFINLITEIDSYIKQKFNLEVIDSKSTIDLKSLSVSGDDKYEPNNNFFDAKQIYYPHTVTGYIPSTSDTDYFKFVAYWGSGTIKISLSVPSDVDLDLFFMNSNGVIFAQSRNTKGINEVLTATVNKNETYYIRINAYGNGSASPYTLSTSEMINGIGSIYDGTPTNVTLSTGQSQDYKFIPGRTGVYSINTGRYGKTGLATDTVLELYDDVAMTNLISSNDNANDSIFSEIRISLRAGQTYYLRLKPANSNTFVSCSLVASYQFYSENDPNVTLTTLLDSYFDSGSEVYTFSPVNSGKYRIFTTYHYDVESNGVSNTVLKIYSDSNLTNLLASNNDYNNTLFSSVDIDLIEGKKYYVRLNGFQGGSVISRLKTTLLIPAYKELQADTPTNIIISNKENTYFKYTANFAGYHQFYTDKVSASTSSLIEIYSDSQQINQLTQRRNAAYVKMNQGVTYYIKVVGISIDRKNVVFNGGKITKFKYNYDSNNHLTQIMAAPTELVLSVYEYDDNGNLLRSR